jgi:hypothetical protein
MHKLPLFAWAVLITAVLLLLSLPVLAGIIIPTFISNSYNFSFFFKPSIIGIVLYVMYRIKANTNFSIVQYILSLTLIYQLGLITELILNMSVLNLELLSSSDYIMNMNNNPNNNVPNNNVPNNNVPNNNVPFNNIPQQSSNNDLGRMVRYLSTNAGALMAANPKSRALALFGVNTFNLIADVLSNEERANYWLDQWNFYQANNRTRGGQPGTGPFERGFNPFNPPSDPDENAGGGSGVNSFTDSPDSPGNNFLLNLLSEANHSIPLETLVNQHFIIILGLFILSLVLLVVILYFYLDLIIIFNKDYFLNKVSNKYVKMYASFIIFRSRIDLIVFGVLILLGLIFFAYCLYYLITHPIHL